MINEPILTVLSMIGLVQLIALISPGPDFAMILRSCTQYGKRYAMLSALGLGLGVAFHATYSLLGLSLIIHSIPFFMHLIATLGAIYLFYQGYKSIYFAFKTKDQMKLPFEDSLTIFSAKTPVAWLAITSGFLTNALNPKAFAFFFSFFAVTVSKIHTPYFGLLAGIEVFLLTWGWFTFLAQVASSKAFLNVIFKYNFFINLLIGVVFILFSVSMMFFAYG